MCSTHTVTSAGQYRCETPEELLNSVMTAALPFSLDDQFAVLREIKIGGFGIVYAGWDGNLHLPIALKEIHPELLLQDSALAAFQAEAQLIARLDHPGIGRLYTLKRAQGRVFMIMEYIDGGDLRNLQLWLKQRGRKLSPSVLLHIIRQVGDALHYAHLRADPNTGAPLHLVHRDVAPSNFMVSRQGAVKLIDFGIARVRGVVRPETMGGVIKGRPQYMSPEQIYAPEVLDARSDIYSLAVVLLDLLTGQSVYGQTTSEYELIDRVRARRFDLPQFFATHNLPRELHAPIEHALQLEPAHRTESARAFIDALEPYAASVGYRENDAQVELRAIAMEAFPPSELQQEFERFRDGRGAANTVTMRLPREQMTPPDGVTRQTLRRDSEAGSGPHVPRRVGVIPWLLAVIVVMAVGAGVWLLFFHAPLAERAAPSAIGADSAAAIAQRGDSATSAVSAPPDGQAATLDTTVVEPAKSELKSTPQQESKQSPASTKARELPVLLKPGDSPTPTAAHRDTPGTLGVQADHNAELFVDGRRIGYLQASDPFWTDAAAGPHTLRVETEGNPGCPLVKELTVNAPLEYVKMVNMATGTLQVNGRIPPGTRVKIAPVSADVKLGSGCDLLTAPFTYRLLTGSYVVETTVNGQPYERKNITINSGATVTLTFQ
jgi:eukaryotic-like serine/threonine-protein kinase